MSFSFLQGGRYFIDFGSGYYVILSVVIVHIGTMFMFFHSSCRKLKTSHVQGFNFSDDAKIGQDVIFQGKRSFFTLKKTLFLEGFTKAEHRHEFQCQHDIILANLWYSIIPLAPSNLVGFLIFHVTHYKSNL